jgi:ATP-dependent DNA helicase RecQ
MSTRERAQALLEQLAGAGAVLREDQWTAIEALVVARRRALVVQRTGWGKSAVYFIAAKLLREQGRGSTVIVSPLLALMRNQVAAAQRAGVHAATINSGNVTEWDMVHRQVAAGELDVLLVSPERLNNPEFRDKVLPALAADAGLVVVDEAHRLKNKDSAVAAELRSLSTDSSPGRVSAVTSWPSALTSSATSSHAHAPSQKPGTRMSGAAGMAVRSAADSDGAE